MRLPAESDPPFGINLVPTIDVIFSILAFFIISTLYLTRAEGLSVNLPQAGTAKSQPAPELTVTIASNGAIAINETPVSLADLTARVSVLLVPDADTLIVINADEAVPHGRVVSVMDRLRELDRVQLAIATKPPDDSR
ncbi:biopolymer transport protein [Rubidibacter lacunae KORDI 51-2]|uniref:Biopolymer transport protein n=1 Tax=Rubidibacter lacunae KORDI 51-2 TaxID=582515 RepID=U5DEH6_9CHRO|nr:biopolymer transporter ExbD [Rubidibacter lacunae]ERN42913.1 biopolymer transport protein [Rubidibacter lacunae KORDI 51-2]